MLPVGTSAPEFSLRDQSGELCQLSALLKTGPVVLFFYPKDETAVCTKEACSFRDGHEEFVHYGAQVFGVSRDSVESHASFAQNHRLNYRLLTDEGGRVAKEYGVKKVLGLAPGRATCVIDTSGKIRLSFTAMLDAQSHIDQALAAVKSLS